MKVLLLGATGLTGGMVLQQQESLFAADAIVCCLGSTIKKAGSRERFRDIDFGIPIKAAELGRRQGVGAFMLMSAVGASASSSVFYNRVKGELEDGLKALAFPLLFIYQPGLLMSDRPEQRLAESMGIKAMPAINCLLRGPMRRYRGIDAMLVAKAMANDVVGLPENQKSQASRVFYRHYDEMVASASSR